jgi:gluconokinase
MKTQIIIGLDIGTSSLKSSIFNIEKRKIIKNTRYEYQFKEVEPGVVPVKGYEDAITDILQNLAKEYDILGIGVSSQMYSICQDTDKGRLVHQWNSLWDKREDKEAQFKDQMKKSGCPMDTLFPAYKLFTMEETKRKSFVPFGLKEHIIQFLCGELSSDYTTASSSGLFDIENKKWNLEFIKLLGFSSSQMPMAKKHNEICGYLRKGIIEGNDSKIAIVPALGDGVSASYACSSSSKICGNVGTSMAVRTFTNKIDIQKDTPLWTFAVDDDTYVTGGISSNSCSVLHWANRLGFENIDKVVQDTKNVMFFPWIHGERTPHWSSNLQGTLMGLEVNTDKEIIKGAILKAIGFTFVKIVETLKDHIEKDSILIIAGGGVHSEGIVEVISGVVPQKLGILNDYDYLASYGAVKSVAEALGTKYENDVYINQIIEPTELYVEDYNNWNKLSEKLIKIY